MSDLKKKFGERVKELRKARGWTQAELAEMLDIEEMSVSRVETGSRFMRKDNIEKLAELFECEIKDLFDFGYIKTEKELRAEIQKKLKKADLKDLKYYNKMIDAYLEAENN